MNGWASAHEALVGEPVPRERAEDVPVVHDDREAGAVGAERRAETLDDHARDVRSRQRVGEAGGHLVQALGALAETLLLVEEHAPLEGQGTLRDDGLEPPPLGIAEDPG